MKIGIIGHGIVGKAVDFGFSKLGHEVRIHDIKLGTSIETLLDSEIIYLCVPTNSLPDGSCDVSIVESVVKNLIDLRFGGIISIKSTVKPGTTEKLINLYNSNKICFCPEFLRERCAITDFVENHDICVIGTDSQECFDIIKLSHGNYPKEVLKLRPTEAEMCKYFVNSYNATLITFANSFYEFCKRCGVDYSVVKNTCVKKSHITDRYLDCNDNLRSFGGTCLPKDVRAINHMLKDTDTKFFENLLQENSKHKVTVFEGMRK